MSLAVKIWSADEPTPPDPKAHNTTAPPNWFHEEPAYAAELYALERFPLHNLSGFEYTIYVIDSEGAQHRFKVRVRRTIDATVYRLP